MKELIERNEEMKDKKYYTETITVRIQVISDIYKVKKSTLNRYQAEVYSHDEDFVFEGYVETGEKRKEERSDKVRGMLYKSLMKALKDPILTEGWEGYSGK